MHRLFALLYLALPALLGIGCSGVSSDPMASLEYARTLDESRPVAEFKLSDQHGRVFSETQLRGTWSVLFVGFTHCPDICPVTLSLLASAQRRAGVTPDRLRTIFVSVDPERDTAERLAEYMGYFNPEWAALTGEKAQIDRLLGSLEMAYVRVPMGDGGYTMDHPTALVLIDPEGRMRGYFAAPLDVGELAEDLGKIARAGR